MKDLLIKRNNLSWTAYNASKMAYRGEASSSVDIGISSAPMRRSSQAKNKVGIETTVEEDIELFNRGDERRSGSISTIKEHRDTTHRALKARHVQLIGIGGTIGTALYVSIGNGLIQGGPGSLFIAFTFWFVILSSSVYFV